MARNFFENGFRLFWPQVDWGGSSPGFVESEFPIMPFLVALFYRVLGVHEWIGRACAAVCSLIAGYALYHLVRKTTCERVALFAAALYLLLPLSLFYSRAFMPDSMMMAASVLSIALFLDWTETGRTKCLVVSGACLSLACLLKLPCLYLGLPVLYLAWRRYGSMFWRQQELWAYAGLVLIPVGAWYAHAHSILLNGGLTFGIWEYGSDKWGNWSLVSSPQFWSGLVFRSVAERWLTWAGFVVAIWGFALVRRNGKERVFDFWLVAVLTYFVIVAKGNFVHEYYQWPLMPAACFFMAKAITQQIYQPQRLVGRGAMIVLVLTICVLGTLRYQSYLKKEDGKSSSVVRIAGEVQRTTKPGDLIVAVDRGNPTILYLCHRKGWHAAPAEVEASLLSKYARGGAKYVVGTVSKGDIQSQEMRERLRERYARVLDDGELLIYALHTGRG